VYQTIKICVALFFYFIITVTNIYSQSFQHRKFKYEWNDAIKVSLQPSPQFKDYEAIILYEETTIDVTTKNIKRYQIYQFNTANAIEKYNLFRVPVTMDPPLARLDNVYRVDTASFPMLLYEKINFFDARIIRGGEIIKAVLGEVAFRNEERTGNKLLPYYLHYFYVRNLEPGDQLEVITSHEWPNYTSKYYLNDVLPKQEINITVNNSTLGQVDVYVNEQLAEFKYNHASKDYTTYQINFENLLPTNPALPTEVQYLPRVEFFENKKYEITNTAFAAEKIDTLNWQEFLYYYVTRIDPGELRSWENYDIQSYKTSQFYDKIKTNSGNLSGAYLMDYINEYAVSQLKYKNDYNYFIQVEHGFNDLGSYLEKGILREASRHEFYYNMIDRVNMPYYKLLLQDNRFHILDTAHVNIMYVDGLSYVLYDNDSVQHLYYPKRGRGGYYTNELPFYYMNQYARLIPQTVPRKIYDRSPGEIKYPMVFIPEPDGKFNTKKNTSTINIQLATKKIELNNKVELSGQFSTLTRNYYLYKEKDTTISTGYYNNIFLKTSIPTCTVDTIQKTFPYKSIFKQSGELNNNIFTTINNEYIIDFNTLINIPFNEINIKTHQANYKHNFTGTEEYIIELNFDQLVSIESMDAYNSNINSESFQLITQLIKITDNQYVIKVTWEIKKQVTPIAQLTQLIEAFKTIKKFNLLKIKVKNQ